jgi:hypothetical protein
MRRLLKNIDNLARFIAVIDIGKQHVPIRTNG